MNLFFHGSVLNMAHQARIRAVLEGVTITCFLMTPETEGMLIEEIPVWESGYGRVANPMIGGVPYRVMPTLMACVHESVALAVTAKTGWILNTEGFPDTGEAFQ